MGQSGNLTLGSPEGKDQGHQNSVKCQGKQCGLWESKVFGKQDSTLGLGELKSFVDLTSRNWKKCVLKVRQRNAGTGVTGAFSRLNLFDKIMAGLDIRRTLANVQSWGGSPGVECGKVWRLFQLSE